MSYESLVIALKEKTGAYKKIETLNKKMEERYKEMVQNNKKGKKEVKVLEEFVRSIIPQ